MAMHKKFQPRLWKVQCLENNYPGMWQRWFKYQCVAVGWPPPKHRLYGESDGGRSWSQARNAILDVRQSADVNPLVEIIRYRLDVDFAPSV